MKPLLNTIPRPCSVLTGQANLELLHVFRDFPVFFGTVDTPADADLRADMSWAIDPQTGLVQLTQLIPLEILYLEQHVDGCGPTWKRYYDDFAEYLLRRHPMAVIEIGGGAGVLARTAVARRSDLPWTIVEPNPTIAPSGGIEVIEGFFSRGLIAGRWFDTVVFSQVMEHVYSPREFIQDIADALAPGQQLVFAYPNLALWLERKFTNTLNFEHTMLLTDAHLDALLPEYGLEIVDKTVYLEHSFFYTARKVAGPVPRPPMPNLYAEYKKLFLDFLGYHRSAVTALNAAMRESPGDFYLFGAHIFSTFLFAFGLQQQRIKGILDNSPTKKGRRLYGTPYIVQNPEVLLGRRDVTVILRAGIYNDEIREGILGINPEVRFI
jgi:2-polyprenyl-3-methyl-5-hydroxy-6-metoxy-1,4-benzoquinol methylase